MFGLSKEEKEIADAERRRQDAELQQIIAKQKSDEISEIMKLSDKEIQAEILLQLRQTVQLNKNMVMDLQNLNEAMRANTKISKQTRDLTAFND